VRVEVFFQDETAWLTQKKMAELFDVKVNTVNYHLKEIFKTGELREKSVIRKIRITAVDGKDYLTSFYNLDAIISVGYRVNSARATQFRIWATKTLRDYIIKGFVLDDERLKNGQYFGQDYFEDLLERIQEIRTSERRFYQKISDLYATSVDYDAKDKTTLEFFAVVQNKMHWAVSGKTAAEIIAQRANSQKTHMGLMTWKHAPKGKILKSDATIAKNYLNKDEISRLNRIVEMYLLYGEAQAKKGTLMKMKDWKEKLDAFLKFNEYEILNQPGKISAKAAKKLAEKEYEKFRIIQDKNYISDFDKGVERFLKRKNKLLIK
jgi:hypothetical protein